MVEIIVTILLVIAVLWVCFFVGSLMKNKSELTKESVISSIQQTSYQLLMMIVTTAVVATNEEFVKLYKGTDEWNDEKKTEAFNRTLNKVLEMLSDEMRVVLEQTFGDVDVLIENVILRTVNDENANAKFAYRM